MKSLRSTRHSHHWVMDMVFRDDECRIRKDNAPANFATIKHIASNLQKPLWQIRFDCRFSKGYVRPQLLVSLPIERCKPILM